MNSAKQTFNDDMMRAETAKLAAETSKINSTNPWYSFILGSGLTLLILIAVNFFLYWIPKNAFLCIFVGIIRNMIKEEKNLLDDKIRAEIAKLNAETAKINRENLCYPFVVGSGVTLALVAIIKLFM